MCSEVSSPASCQIQGWIAAVSQGRKGQRRLHKLFAGQRKRLVLLLSLSSHQIRHNQCGACHVLSSWPLLIFREDEIKWLVATAWPEAQRLLSVIVTDFRSNPSWIMSTWVTTHQVVHCPTPKEHGCTLLPSAAIQVGSKVFAYHPIFCTAKWHVCI